MINLNKFFALAVCALFAGCAHNSSNTVSERDASRIDRTLVKDTVVYEPGSKDDAVVPDISAPRLRAEWIPEHQENGRLVEAHREWVLEGDVAILGIPKKKRNQE